MNEDQKLIRGDWKEERNYGLDLLRIVAMIGVVINHIITQGGVLQNATGTAKQIVWFVLTVAYLSVDCYVIVSGYVNFRKSDNRIKISRIIELWLIVVFWGFMIDFAGILCFKHFSINILLRSLLPIGFQEYWFFSRFFLLYLFMPVLNCAWRYFKKDVAAYILALLTALLSGYATIISPLGDPFKVESGYGITWFIYLYLLGAAIKQYGFFLSQKRNKLIALYVSGVVITWFCVVYLGKITEIVVGRQLGESIFFSYNSPTILVAAVSVVALFINISPNIAWRRIVQFFAPLSFGVYIIHMHPIVKEYLLVNHFVFVLKSNIVAIPVLLICMGVAITAVCLFLEKGRDCLFKMFRVRRWLIRIENRIDRYLQNLLGAKNAHI